MILIHIELILFFGKKLDFQKKLKYSENYWDHMTTQDKSIVGKKGEILPKKPLRDIAGINPGDQILIDASPGKFIITKIYSVEELLAMPIIARGTPDSIEKDIEEELKQQEELTNAEH